MPYTTATDIKTEFPSITYASSTDEGIVESEVTTWCDEFSAYMNSKLQNRYVTPVTGTEALKVLSLICKDFVVGKIKMKLFLTGGGKSEDQKVQAEQLTKLAEARLAALNKGESVLVGAPTQNGPVSDSYGRRNEKTPLFDIDEQQW